MARKKSKRKTKRKTRRKKDDFFDFGFDMPKIDVPEIEMPKMELPSLALGFEQRQRKVAPSKIPKAKLVGILSQALSTEQIYRSLIRLGKHRLAEEFLNEVGLINKKYDKILAEVEGKKEETLGDRILTTIVDEIIWHMKRLYQQSQIYANETEFQKEIKAFLNGMASVMETSLAKFGWNVNIAREYRFPSNERIDLLVLVGNAKIGIEVKYDLEETSKLQRLLGQIDRYCPNLDFLIVVSYKPLSANAINAIKNKENEKEIPIKIVTPTRVV